MLLYEEINCEGIHRSVMFVYMFVRISYQRILLKAVRTILSFENGLLLITEFIRYILREELQYIALNGNIIVYLVNRRNGLILMKL